LPGPKNHSGAVNSWNDLKKEKGLGNIHPHEKLRKAGAHKGGGEGRKGERVSPVG